MSRYQKVIYRNTVYFMKNNRSDCGVMIIVRLKFLTF
nr:MAG TPA: hypothetical protein [Caudoviricetes sp.]